MKSVFLCNVCPHMSGAGAVLGTGCGPRELISLVQSVHPLLKQSIAGKGDIYLLLDKKRTKAVRKRKYVEKCDF